MQTIYLLAKQKKHKALIVINAVLYLLLSFVSSAQDTRNFIKVWDALAPETNPSLLMGKGVKEVRQTSQYFDGLGRPEQTVVKGGAFDIWTGQAATDLVSVNEYDQFGREAKKHLPYVASSSDGMYKTNALASQQSFNQDWFSSQGESNFYGLTEFEASPLNRVVKQMAPGVNWVGANRGVGMDYLINTAADEVRIWTVTDVSNDFGTDASSSTYPAGELYKTITTDEHGKKVVEYKDKQGQVVLKKVQVADAPGANHTGWLCTYYIYDDLNQLRAVIQPKAVEAMNNANNWTLDATTLNELVFRYEYDARGRMTMKKVPGAGVVYMVYDARDRLVMTQDANMRQSGQWMVTLYDHLNRPTETGLWGNANNLSYHAGLAYTSTAYPFASTNVPGSGYEVQTRTFYDNYDWIPTYGYLVSGVRLNAYDSYLQSATSSFPYTQASTTQITQTKGLVTGTLKRIIGTPYSLGTSIIYDDKSRVIQTQSNNIFGGLDVITNQYTWNGQLITNVSKTAQGSTSTFIVTTKNELDDLGRVWSISKTVSSTINGVSVSKFVPFASRYIYNKLGQLVTRQLGPEFNGWAGLERLDYEYNVRGWMLGANRGYLKDKNASGYQQRYFGFELAYDKGTITPGSANDGALQYNGNIYNSVWKSAGDGVRRKYTIFYDNVNRLGKAHFYQNIDETSGVTWNAQEANFSVHGFDADNSYYLKYDANGNILGMVEHGIKGLTPDAYIDALRYEYFPNSNKLRMVHDDYSNAQTKLGDFHDGNEGFWGTDYGYDKNGNLVTDRNKYIDGTTGIDVTSGGPISYNYLNLPTSIAVNNSNGTYKGNISYQHDASGNKLTKTVTENGQPNKTTLYVNGLVFEDNVLQFIPMEEGRIRFKPAVGATPASLELDYFVKDHLGNVRMVLTEEQKTDAYPAATMETASASTEQALYSKVAETRVDKPSGYPYDGYLDPHYKVAKVRGDGQKIGPGMVLKVMAGDKINLRVSSYWNSGASPDPNPANPLNDLIAVLSGSIAPLAGGKASSSDLSGSSVFSNQAQSFLNSRSYTSSKPKAYVQWVFFDEQFKYVSSSSGFEQVGNSGSLTTHIRSNLPVDKNGYVYVYVSNETTNLDVFFDNLQVSHIHGPIVEETHYYPFGLTMAGISSKAAQTSDCGCPNKKGFNGNELQNKEFSDGSGLDVYDFNARTYDQQIGRFIQIDPMTDEMNQETLSPYHFGGNNPIRYNDPDGRCFPCLVWEIAETAVAAFAVYSGSQTLANNIQNNNNGGGDATWEQREQQRIQKTGEALQRAAQQYAAKNNQGDIYRPKDVVRTDGSNQNTGKSKAQERADKLSQKPRPGEDMTKAGKEAVKDLNKEKNNGQMVCENCGTQVQNGKKHERGVTPPSNEAHVDHIDAKSNGGSGTPNNGQVLCRDCNLDKSNKQINRDHAR